MLGKSEEQFNFVPTRQSEPHVFCKTKTSNFHKTFLPGKIASSWSCLFRPGDVNLLTSRDKMALHDRDN